MRVAFNCITLAADKRGRKDPPLVCRGGSAGPPTPSANQRGVDPASFEYMRPVDEYEIDLGSAINGGRMHHHCHVLFGSPQPPGAQMVR